jgi:hypothetical protein
LDNLSSFIVNKASHIPKVQLNKLLKKGGNFKKLLNKREVISNKRPMMALYLTMKFLIPDISYFNQINIPTTWSSKAST